MKILVYEYVTGGGWWGQSQPWPPVASLLREGAAMARAVIDDFRQLPDVEVLTLQDRRLGDSPLSPARTTFICDADQETRRLRQLCQEADWTLLIAPESDSALLSRSRLVEQSGGRLLSPAAPFVELAADKYAIGRRLSAAGLPTPTSTLWQAGEPPPPDLPYPAVVKPRYGAGSQDIQLVANRPELLAELQRRGWGKGDRSNLPARPEGWWGKGDRSNLPARPEGCFAQIGPVPFSPPPQVCIERYHPGTAASVAVLCGAAGPVVLPACLQRLTADGRFQYLGGEAPLAEALRLRAGRLGEAAVNALPPTIGYIGIDLVLGPAADGRDDVVIEINPRLTTSYVGLHRLMRPNLAQAMLAIAQGLPVELALAQTLVRFHADGTVADGTVEDGKVVDGKVDA